MDNAQLLAAARSASKGQSSGRATEFSSSSKVANGLDHRIWQREGKSRELMRLRATCGETRGEGGGGGHRR